MKTRHLLSGLVIAAFGITTAVAAAQSAGAQADKQKASGKPHTMTGCLEKGEDATSFTLTNVEGTGPKTVQLHAREDQKLSAHVGHKVAITGPDIDPSTVKKGTTGKPAAGAKPEAGADTKSSASTEHHMRVTSVKMISASCPQ